MKIVMISDTHGLHSLMKPLPQGDVLIHAGDCLNSGSFEELYQFLYWFKKQPHKYKIMIAGNHDWCFERKPEQAQKVVRNTLDMAGGIIYLQDSSIEIEGVKFYGSPWQPFFCDWAFNLNRGKDLYDKWQMIPEDTDVLITHGPPYGILDLAPGDRHVGCEELEARIYKMWGNTEKLKIHVFGHLHGSYGTGRIGNVRFYNAAICTEQYEPTNEPWEIEL